MKTVKKQAEDQRQQLHITEIDLATQKQLVMDLKAELQKVKEATRVAREAFEAAETTSYKRGVLETETRLAKEVIGVCMDYCTKTWAEALNQVGVPVDSELRRSESIFFPKDIREIPEMLPIPIADLFPLARQFPATQAPTPHAEDLIGVGKGKEVQPMVKANQFEDDLTIKDMVSKAKDEEVKSKAGDAHFKVVDSKKDPLQAKT